MLISFFLMIIISTSLTVPGQPSHRFHVEAWLPFRNSEMDFFFQVFNYNFFLLGGKFDTFATIFKLENFYIKINKYPSVAASTIHIFLY